MQGGNAIEAMVAMAASIAVVYPAHELHRRRRLLAHPRTQGQGARDRGLRLRRRSARRSQRYRARIGGIPTRGPKAALTVPGAIGGWKMALELSSALGGRLPLADLLEPAVRMAREGVPVSASEARFDPRDDAALHRRAEFRARPSSIDGEPPKAGAIRKLPQPRRHARPARATPGLDDFYRGDVAREIAADLEALGSPVTRADLKAYQARWREPLSMRLEDATLYNTPAPTQGLASLMMLGLYERLGVARASTASTTPMR